jgi:hypothetical protein
MQTRTPTLTCGCQCGAVRYALYSMPTIAACAFPGETGQKRLWGNNWGNRQTA